MKSLWKGAITFGLITIPVRLYTAVEEKTLRFNQLHVTDNGRIKYKRVCSVCDQEVPWDEIVKGFEYEKDRYVIFTDEELERVPGDRVRAIDVVSFVPLEEIDPIYFQRSYYVAPEPVGLKAYRLLQQALDKSGRIAVAKVTLRDKEHLGTLRLRGDVFVLETMYWPDEIREPEFEELDKQAEVRRQELDMALALIENLSEHFDPSQFHDTYREKLDEMARSKIAGEEIAVAPAAEPTQVLDLMEALRASVEATRARAGAGDPEKEETRSA